MHQLEHSFTLLAEAAYPSLYTNKDVGEMHPVNTRGRNKAIEFPGTPMDETLSSNHIMPITLQFSGVCIWEVYGHWAKMPWNVRKKNSQRLRNLAALLCYPILPPYFARFC